MNREVCLLLIIFSSALVGAGCESLHNAGVPGLEMYAKPDTAQTEKARSQRDLFATSRDHKAFYWLLANCIRTGMHVNDVEHALGEPGELENDTNLYKSEGVQTTDTAFKWGPDSSGHSAILFFRDGHVINFNPKDFANP